LDVFIVLAVALAGSVPSQNVRVPDQLQLTRQIRAADDQLFDLFFVKPCDAPRFRALLADDVEFYHDKDGYTIHSAGDFMKDYQANCASRTDPTAWRSRRELVIASLSIDPRPGYGAMEAGEH